MLRRYAFVLVAAVAGSVVAQDGLAGYPECSRQCWTDSLPSVGCQVDDATCTCARREELTPLLVPCLIADCGVDVVIDISEEFQRRCYPPEELVSEIESVSSASAASPTSPSSTETSTESTSSPSSSSTESEDGASSTTTTSEQTSSATSSESPSPTTDGSGTGSGDGDGGSSGGLNPTAIGLGVGIGVGGLGLVIAVFFLVRRCRRRRRTDVAAAVEEEAPRGDTTPANAGGFEKSELPSPTPQNVHEAADTPYIPEAWGSPVDHHPEGRYEAPPNEMRHEMYAAPPGIQGRHELGDRN